MPDIQITIATAHLIRIKYPLSSFNYRLSGTNVANFNKIHHTVSEQQLFKKEALLSRRAQRVHCAKLVYFMTFIGDKQQINS